MTLRRMYLIIPLMAIFLISCAFFNPTAPNIKLHRSNSVKDQTRLRESAGLYYTASDIKKMRAAVEAAKKSDPHSSIYHEIAANLSYLEDRRSDRFNHLISALLDFDNDVPLLHLYGLSQMNWTIDERKIMEKLLNILVKDHSNPEIKAAAAHHLSKAMFIKGHHNSMDRLKSSYGWPIPFSLIGTWDNDQDKGFDLPYPPEKEINTQRTYAGQHVDVRWRTKYPRALTDGTINLKELLYPDQWAVAYLAAAINVKIQAQYELRMISTDALKVWVNDVLVFENRHISRGSFDGILIPVTLRKGVNKILIKSVQKRHLWKFNARLTLPGGKRAEQGTFKPVTVDTPVQTEGPGPGDGITIEKMIDHHISHVKNDSRRQYLKIRFAEMLGLNVQAVRYSDQFTSIQSRSIPGRYQHAVSLWGNGERGRTSDILNQLFETTGKELPLIAGKQARFWRQNNFKQKSRKLLLDIIKDYPDRPTARIELEKLYKTEGWTEDRLNILKEINRNWPDWPAFQLSMASLYDKIGFQKNAESIYRKINSHLPNHEQTLSALSRFARRKQEYKKAEYYAKQLVDSIPDRRLYRSMLGKIQQYSGNQKKSEVTYFRLIDMAPTSPEGYRQVAELAYLNGNKEKAVRFWEKSLKRDPDNEKLANRLDFLSPPVSGAWATDVPDEKSIQQAISLRNRLTFHKGADTVLLLDDLVTRLNSDGSTVSVETSVTHVLNKSGRDHMTKFTLNGSGQSRIICAYSVDPEGRRVEASSIRGRTIRFRKMKIGSTVVVQYRNDSPPSKYLAEYFAANWYFQVFRTQVVKSRYVLWAPEEADVSEYTKGDIERSESKHGSLKRITWNASSTPVLVSEEDMPPFNEIGWMLNISTVPGWDMFHKWEEALLQDAFRESPEINQLAEELFQGALTPIEKIHKIQEFLITEIRYQKDYEHYITGVKPHAAPVVLARRYGDCKDKAVLFITLAKLGGVEARFALVRTRNYGQIKREIPMQQFNHAIVYIPSQFGNKNGFFIDPTVDALDVDILRGDNQGTWALVLNLKGGWRWVFIPFQNPSKEYVKKNVTLDLKKNGNAEAEMTITAKGNSGEAVRKTGRNHENYIRFLQNVINHFIPGAKLTKHQAVSIKDVNQPAQIKLNFDAPVFARKEGKELRYKIPETWWASSLFSLEKRIHPLVLGVPHTEITEIEFRLPHGSRFKRVPKSKTIQTKYLSFKRNFRRSNKRLMVTDSLIWLAERVPVDEYAILRNKIDQIIQIQDEDVVFTVE